MDTAFMILSIISALWGVVSSIVIVSSLSDRGEKINFLLLRLFLPKYVARYRMLMIQETGTPGAWYYSFVSSMMGALAFAALGLLLRAL